LDTGNHERMQICPKCEHDQRDETDKNNIPHFGAKNIKIQQESERGVGLNEIKS